MLQTKVGEKTKTHILYSVNFFFGNLALCEIMWKTITEPGRPWMKLWCVHIAYWIANTTKTLSEYVINFVFPLRQWLHEHASTLRQKYTACLSYLL